VRRRPREDQGCGPRKALTETLGQLRPVSAQWEGPHLVVPDPQQIEHLGIQVQAGQPDSHDTPDPAVRTSTAKAVFADARRGTGASWPARSDAAVAAEEPAERAQHRAFLTTTPRSGGGQHPASEP